MKKTSALALALAAAFLAAAPARAQHNHGGGNAQPQGGARQMSMDLHHAGPHAPLEHREHIGLTADQVQRLEAVEATLAAAHKENCMAMHAHGASDEARHQAAHTAMRAAYMNAIRETQMVLTSEQRGQVAAMAAQHRAAGHGQGQAAGGHAAHGQSHAAGGHGEHGAGHGQHGGHDCCKDGQCDAAKCEECCKETASPCALHGVESPGAAHSH